MLFRKKKIDYSDDAICDRIAASSIRRASKWMTLSKHDHRIRPMIGQVGGLGVNRKPMLTLVPDYILKPLLLDHRGVREIAFYEAIRTITQSPPQQVQSNYLTFLTRREQQPSSTIKDNETSISVINAATKTTTHTHSWMSLMANIQHTITTCLSKIMESIDTISMAIAIGIIQDRIVLQYETLLQDGWQNLQIEIDMMRQLHKLTPPYYGVIVQSLSPSTTTTTIATTATTDAADSTADISTVKDQLTQPDIPYSSTIPVPILDANHQQKHTYWSQLVDSHLLLQDLTFNYSKPCVLDLKMGVQTYVRFVLFITHDLNIRFHFTLMRKVHFSSTNQSIFIFTVPRNRTRRSKNVHVNTVNIQNKRNSDSVSLVCDFMIRHIQMPMVKDIDILKSRTGDH
jgi:Inositol polyphosphate kinase